MYGSGRFLNESFTFWILYIRLISKRDFLLVQDEPDEGSRDFVVMGTQWDVPGINGTDDRFRNLGQNTKWHTPETNLCFLPNVSLKSFSEIKQKTKISFWYWLSKNPLP